MPSQGNSDPALTEPPTSDNAKTQRENDLLPRNISLVVKNRAEAIKSLKSASFIGKADDIKSIHGLAMAFFKFVEPPAGQKRIYSSHPDRSFLEAIGRILLGFCLDPQEQVRTYINDALDSFADEVKASIREQCDKVIAVTTETNLNISTLANETSKVSTTVKQSAEEVARTYCMVASAPAVPSGPAAQPAKRPHILNLQEKHNRQIMLKLNDDNPLLSEDTSDDDVRKQIQEALSSLDVDDSHDTTINSASRKSPRKDTILLELASQATSQWLKEDERVVALATRLGATVQNRTYQVMVRRIPLTYDADIRSPEAPAIVAKDNNLEPGEVKSVKWIKPAERRSEDQRSAYAMISLTTPQAANRLILRGVELCDSNRDAVRSTRDAPRCLKCQLYGHLAKDCPNNEMCGTCGGAHPTRGCRNLRNPWCASCKSKDHSSWDRDCPVFITESSKLVKNNENDYVYFPTKEPWTWALKTRKKPGHQRSQIPTNHSAPQHRIDQRPNIKQGERKRQAKSKYAVPSQPPETPQGRPRFLTGTNTVPFPSPSAGPSRWPQTAAKATTNEQDAPPLPPVDLPYNPNQLWSDLADGTGTQTTPSNEAQNHDEILQINLNKSNEAQQDLINDPDLHSGWDVVLLQEPSVNFYNYITTPRGFRQVYPGARARQSKTVRSGIWVNEKISTNTWRALEIEDSADVTAIQLDGEHGKLTIFSIYNDCTNDDSERALGSKHELTPEARRNYRMTNWDGFNANLLIALHDWDTATDIPNPVVFDELVERLEQALDSAVRANTPLYSQTKYAKRWWNKDLSAMRIKKQKLAWLHAKHSGDKDHPIHEEYRRTRNEYGEAITAAKEEHWRLFLEEATEREMWIANGYLKSPVGDAGRPRMPSLKITREGQEVTIDTNDQKAESLAESFFPPRPAVVHPNPPLHEYPPALQANLPLTEDRVKAQIKKLSAHKAPGPDGIPNLSMMTRPAGGCDWSASHNSRFEMSKVAVMHFSRKTESTQGQNLKLRELAPPLVINGTTIAVVEEYKYLGVLVDPEVRWRQQAARAAERAAEWILLFKRLTNAQRGMSSKLMRHLYRPIGARNTKGSVEPLRRIKTVQKTATLAITGALKGSAADILDPHAGIPPAEVMLWSICKRSYIRLCSLPRDHVLHTIIASAHGIRDRDPKHLTPIETLAKLFDINPSATEKIPTLKSPSDVTNFVNTISFSTREESINHEKGDESKVKVYTDGSGQDGYVGAAASLYLNDMTNPVATRHIHLGTIGQHSTYEAELVGILLAIWLLITEAGHVLGRRPISIYTDNQSAIGAITSASRGPAEYIKDEIARLCAKYFPNLPRFQKVDIKWISAHSEVPRNEKIDYEAKQASLGLSSAKQLLPRLLRTDLPLSVSALRQDLKTEIKEKSDAAIRLSPRWERFAPLEEDYNFTNFRKVADSVDRFKASLLVKMRTGHIPLNSYLHKRKLHPSGICASCNDGARETLHHYVLECSSHATQRLTLREKIGEHTNTVMAYATDLGE
ncbi:hypothetical protein CVT24_006959, partial [Panaeolus cyanescens]